MHISFAAETLFTIFGFPITNTLLNTLFVDIILLSIAFYIYKNIQRIPKGLQNIVEMVIETFYTLTKSVSEKRADVIFPYFMSFFLFILVANWSGLLPGFGTIGFYEKAQVETTNETQSVKQDEHATVFKPLFRAATTDFNTTLGLTFVSIVTTHILSIKYTGFGDYISRFLPISPMIVIGLLEIISELVKVVSLSFRLFGNIFAGEVLLGTIANIFPFSAFLIPIPFLLLETIVGLVQALVFSMLTMAFMSIFITPHHQKADH